MSGFDDFVARREGDTLTNVIIGVLISVVASPAAGGLAAGFLQHEGSRDGARVGGIVGAVTLLPAVPIFGFFFLVSGFGFVGADAGAIGVSFFFLLFALFFVLLGALFTVGVGALAGYVGGYVAEDYHPNVDDHRSATEV